MPEKMGGAICFGESKNNSGGRIGYLCEQAWQRSMSLSLEKTGVLTASTLQ
jgi:hypothetical protein